MNILVNIKIKISNIYMRLIVNMCITIILQIIINIVIFKKTSEFDYCVKVLKDTCIKFIRKVQKNEKCKS